MIKATTRAVTWLVCAGSIAVLGAIAGCTQHSGASRAGGASGSDAGQISGVPGSPSATVTLDGKQLPPPPMKFGGVIKEDAKDSKPYWPPSVVPPKGAP